MELNEEDTALGQAHAQARSIREMVEELEAVSNDGTAKDVETAEQRIQEDALSVEVRSGWYVSGAAPEPEEFKILLCCGGPHVEMRGELGKHGEPENVALYYQDWGTGLIKRDNQPGDQEAFLIYAGQFYFCY